MEYRAIDQSKDLQHWKYIKRYKGSNGKWRYVYADKSTHKNISNEIRTADNWKRTSDEYSEKSDKTYALYERATKYNVGTPENRANTRDDSFNYYDTSAYARVESEKHKRQANDTIEQNSVKKQTSELVSIGKDSVNNLINNLNKARKILV